MKKGFTLIELLVVVAIISILASIAVVNLLHAQVRSRVARVKADMRTYATAIEAYSVDNNRMLTCRPPAPSFGIVGQSVFFPDVDRAVSARLVRLTTPVAYITSICRDPFIPSKTCINGFGAETDEYDTYDYVCSWDFDIVNDPQNRRGASLSSGAGWRLASAGPDKIQCYGGGAAGSNSQDNSLGVDYDPTNGTQSVGDIVLVGGGPGPIYQKLPAIDRIQNKYNDRDLF